MPSIISFLLSLSLLLLLGATSTAVTSPSPSSLPSVTPADACKTSTYPKLCRSILSTFRSSSNPFDYGRFSVKQCLKRAQKSSAILHQFLTRKPSLHHIESGVLDDCRQLTDLNDDYLATISAELDSARSMTPEKTDRVRTLLSAVITNQQTCYDDLETSRSNLLKGVLVGPLANATQLYSVSLGLISNALPAKRRKGKGKKPDGWDRVLTVSSFSDSVRERFVHGRASDLSTKDGRNLLDEEGQGVLASEVVTVALDGSGNFTTISDAIAFAPNNSRSDDGYFVIYVTQGLYQENVLVAKNKKNLMFIGDGINNTVITGNRSVVDGWTTFNSATFAVTGERFIAVDITFQNTAGPAKHQAVAVRNNADLSSFYRCSFEGYQDTLYVHSLRQFYRDCDIYGTVDFIFGNAAAVFQNCNLYARKPMTGQKNAFTAQGRTDPNQNTGISIHNCTVRAAPDLAEQLNSTRNYLGRPWKVYSRTVYMQSFIDSLIEPVGWLEWDGDFALDTLFYGEYQNYGPGANTTYRVHWPGYSLMDASQAANFTVYNFTMGDTWLPSTAIPFSSGLV